MSHFPLVSIKNPGAGIEANSDASLYGEGVYHPPYKGNLPLPQGCSVTDAQMHLFRIIQFFYLHTQLLQITHLPSSLGIIPEWIFIFKIVSSITLNKYWAAL